MYSNLDQEAARQRFHNLRLDSERIQANNVLLKTEHNIQGAEHNLITISNELKTASPFTYEEEKAFSRLELAQKRLLALEVKKQALLDDMDGLESTDPIQIEREFQKILALPQFLSIGIGNNGEIVIMLAATHTYQGVNYDLGDWAIGFAFVSNPYMDIPNGNNWSNDMPLFDSEQVRDGTQDSWLAGDAHYPSYARATLEFCFGSTEELIKVHFKKRQYLHAVQLAAYALCSINDGDEHDIPLAFKTLNTDRKEHHA